MPGSILTSVASLVDHFKVADWPRSMDVGSTLKVAVGRGGAGFGFSTGGGGGGGGGGVFFLQPAKNRNNDSDSSTALIFRLLILKVRLLDS